MGVCTGKDGRTDGRPGEDGRQPGRTAARQNTDVDADASCAHDGNQTDARPNSARSCLRPSLHPASSASRCLSTRLLACCEQWPGARARGCTPGDHVFYHRLREYTLIVLHPEPILCHSSLREGRDGPSQRQRKKANQIRAHHLDIPSNGTLLESYHEIHTSTLPHPKLFTRNDATCNISWGGPSLYPEVESESHYSLHLVA